MAAGLTSLVEFIEALRCLVKRRFFFFSLSLLLVAGGGKEDFFGFGQELLNFDFLR